jgi:hypothetical protein
LIADFHTNHDSFLKKIHNQSGSLLRDFSCSSFQQKEDNKKINSDDLKKILKDV